MNEAVGRAAEAVEVFTELGVESVMNRFNRTETDATDVDQIDS